MLVGRRGQGRTPPPSEAQGYKDQVWVCSPASSHNIMTTYPSLGAWPCRSWPNAAREPESHSIFKTLLCVADHALVMADMTPHCYAGGKAEGMGASPPPLPAATRNWGEPAATHVALVRIVGVHPCT